MADDIEIPGLKDLDVGVKVEPVIRTGVTVRAPSAEEMAKINAGNKVDLSSLNPDLKARIDALNEIWKADTKLNPKGEDLPIISGYRTTDEQKSLFLDRLRNPNLVAAPGTSRHESGNAIDLHPRVPTALLAQVGLHRPLGSRDIPHVTINPDIEWTPKEPVSGSDITIPGLQDIDQNYVPPEPDAWYKQFGKQAASTADIALGTVPAAAQFVGEPFAKLIDRVGNTKVAEEALAKVTGFFDKPVGKFFGIENDPTYNAEAARRIMDYAAQNVDKGADYISKNTGMSKSDAQWFINAALLKAAPTVGKVAKATGKAVGEVATAENVGNLLSEISGKMTTTPAFNTQRGYKAGYNINPTILESATPGAVSAPEIVGNVRQAFANVKENRRQAYQEGIKSTKGNQVYLDFEPIRAKFDEMVDSLKSKNLGVEESKVGEKTMNKVEEIRKIIDRWEKKPELHTAANLDDLKQRIDDVYEQGMTNNAERVMTATRNAVKDTIAKQDPNYEKTMADYEQGLKFEREIQQALGLGEKTSVDTTIRKISQVFSNKSSLSKEYRLELLQEMERVGGKDLIDKLVGYAMSQSTPNSLQLLADIAVATGAHMMAPGAGVGTLLGAVAAQSPKLALYGAYGAGRTARAISDIGQAAKEQVAKGKTKLSEITSRK